MWHGYVLSLPTSCMRCAGNFQLSYELSADGATIVAS